MTKARIDARFAQLKAEGRAGFVAYVMAGDPDEQTALDIIRGLVRSGADLIELGMPFTDPMADGPAIQKAALRSLKAGTKTAGVLRTARAFRDQDQDTPLILMGYLNPVLSHGYEQFAQDAAAAGVDGLIMVDCPPEEADPLADALDRAGLALIRLATPTTDDARLPVVVRRTAGFVYYVSMAGVTGVGEADADSVAPAVARVRAASGLPVAVGFGVKTPQRAAAIAKVADAVVVGSALVEEIEAAISANENVTTRVLSKASSLAQAVRSARRAD
ncbi:MAG: tryptophan synthase, alpha subunit [Caulobacteraceae bacterium]|nr:tryptophan synthase, alpha subunit [Caulobacteraceae bacterium]